VRDGHHVTDAIRRHPNHFDRYLPVFGPVVDARQNMSMKIDHFLSNFHQHLFYQ
jgi:hypothetical protein